MVFIECAAESDWIEPKNPFPEADLLNNLSSGANRARLNWYLIDDSRNAAVRVRNDADTRNPYTAIIQQKEIFPNLVTTPDQLPTIQTFNLPTYYPMKRSSVQLLLSRREGYRGR